MVFKESIIPMLMKIIVFCQGCLIAESGANCGAGGGGAMPQFRFLLGLNACWVPRNFARTSGHFAHIRCQPFDQLRSEQRKATPAYLTHLF